MINLTTPNSSSFISIFCIELKHRIAIAAHGFTSHCHRCSSPYFASRYNIELPLHLIVSHRIAIVVHPYILHRVTTSNCHRSSLFHIASPSLFIPIFCIELQHRIPIASHCFTSNHPRCSSLYFALMYNVELPSQLIVFISSPQRHHPSTLFWNLILFLFHHACQSKHRRLCMARMGMY
jgi:hypothetical protein